mgnify:CR=1 FL=1
MKKKPKNFFSKKYRVLFAMYYYYYFCFQVINYSLLLKLNWDERFEEKVVGICGRSGFWG